MLKPKFFVDTLYRLYCLLLIIAAIAFSGCKQSGKANPFTILSGEEVLHNNVKYLTDIIVLDVFSPPVSGRIYAYSTLAQYEAARFADTLNFPSIVEKLKGFHVMPRPEANMRYNFDIAAAQAFYTMAREVIFLKDSLAAYIERTVAMLSQQYDTDVVSRSVRLGDSIGRLILRRSLLDNYKETRGFPRFMVAPSSAQWKPTPPDYNDALEPYWNKIACLLMDSSSQFKPNRPDIYSTDKTSRFFKELQEVYATTKNLNDSQKTIAEFWDDNPFTLVHNGHLAYSNKKVTPGGHWLGITAIACKQSKASAATTARAYALVSLGLFEGFISCWDEKYRSNTIRPVTAINDLISRDWQAYLQTPPFPEYTSGHSVISGASSVMLTKLFGENFFFSDTSELEYIGLKRDFSSFKNAAQEAALSRLYGGIHYRNSVQVGLQQGELIGNFILKKVLNDK